MDRARRPGRDSSREALDRLELICDTYLSVSTPVQVAARIAARDGARRCGAQILDRLRANDATLRAVVDGVSGADRCCRADGGWSAVIRVPATRAEEELVARSARARRRRRPSRLLLRLPARSLSGRQPAARARRRSRAASRLRAGSTRCRVISSTAATPACSCRCSRFRRARAGASARSPICRGSALDGATPGSRSCSCCRSTRWRTGRTRRTRR